MTSKRQFLICFILLLLGNLAVYGASLRSDPVLSDIRLEGLPLQIGQFQGKRDAFPDSVYRELKADHHVYRHYEDPQGNKIDLYIGYYSTASGGRSRHNPLACLPGSGWAVVETGKETLTPRIHPGGVKVNYILAKKDGVNSMLLHWYQSDRTRILGNGVEQNINRFWGRITRNRDDGAYVQVSAYAADRDLETTRRLLERFSVSIMDALPDNWPVELDSVASLKER